MPLSLLCAPRLRACAMAVVGILGVACAAPKSFGAIIASDYFGDGDRNNDGTTEVAPEAVNPDVGLAWYNTAGTSAITFKVINDSTSITNNTLQVFNTGSNNRPIAGRFAAQSLADGDSLVLRFDMKLMTSTNAAGTSVQTPDRALRFGLYNDGGTWTSGDKGSSDTTYNDDVGYNARLDVAGDASNSTSMDVTRDDSAADTILTATTTGLGISSTDTANQMNLGDNVAHHFVLSLTRSGTGMLVSLKKDSNAAISGTDASPPGNFTFNEIVFSLRSSAAMDVRIDNVELEYTAAVPEPATAGLLAGGSLLAALRRRRPAR